MTVEHCEKIAADLQDQRDALIGRIKTLGTQREAVSYAAYTGNKDAKAKLDKINIEASTIGHEIVSIEAAIAEAEKRLNTAKAAEAQAADRTNALKLRDKLAKFRELGAVLDDCFTDFKSAGFEQKQVLDDIHNLGQPTPSAQQYRVLCEVALKTAVQGTPFWSQDFPAMAPNQRKTFKSIGDAWCEVIEANIAARLGEQKKKDAA
jgi:chromosome segregation ATPase